jgi:DNA excision repair protein ERCC-2
MSESISTQHISAKDFALPIPRRGSIEPNSGYQWVSEDSLRIRRETIARLKRENPLFESSKKITSSFEIQNQIWEIEGLADLWLEPTESEPGHIELIFSAFQTHELEEKLSDSQDWHPYCLQLRLLGYLIWKNTGVEPELVLRLISTRDRKDSELTIKLDRAELQKWVDARFDEIQAELKHQQDRTDHRRQLSRSFEFPFETPRTGQVELIQTLESHLENRERTLVQAPTGLGKTIGVLYPTLREAFSRGQRAIYVTPKNSQHSVAEQAAEKLRENGSPLRSLTFTAKSKICFKNEPICNPEYCEFARDYYEKVDSRQLLPKLLDEPELDAKKLRSYGELFEVCPFELQLDAAVDRDLLIADYNYVFAPRTAFRRLTISDSTQVGKPSLVIDEAHNLPSRAMDYYSPALSTVVLDRMREAIQDLPNHLANDCEELLDQGIQVVLDCKPTNGLAQKITLDPIPFEDHDAKLKSFLSRYLESGTEIQPRDVVMRLVFYWSEFVQALEFLEGDDELELGSPFFVTFQPHPSGGIVKITCSDASQFLRVRYDDFEQVVAFSATLKPFDYFAKLTGLDPETTKIAEFESPFPIENRKVLIIPQISTKLKDREQSIPKICEVIYRLSEIKRGNYFVFFPSFDFLERTLARFAPPKDFMVVRQDRETKIADVETVMEHLKTSGKATLIFAVQGGVFSEGVDYPGDMIIGAFIVGPPLPNFDLERETIRGFYAARYGAEKAFDYAYTFPAMAKAIQAAGRVIRSETDRGLLVLMDSRFVQKSYSQSMPKGWFVESPHELVSKALVQDVREFWERDCTQSE